MNLNLKPGSAGWSVIRTIVVLVFVSFVLWMNASNFDETEVKTILWTALGLAGLETGALISKNKTNNP